MRYFWAIFSLALGILLLIAGFGYRAVLSASEGISSEVALPKGTEYAVVSAEELGKYDGMPRIDVDSADVQAAQGRTADVLGWVGDYEYAAVSFSGPKAEPSVEQVKPRPVESQEAGEPRPWESLSGSDLWVSEYQVAEGAQNLQVQPKSISVDQSILLSAKKEGSLPETVTVVWKQPLHAPWSGPLFVAGAVLTLLGLVLYVIFVDRDRRGLGPRRGRKGPLLGIRDSVTRKHKRDLKNANRASRVAAVGLIATLGLTGCSSSYWPQMGEQEVPDGVSDTVALSTVSDAQIGRIVEAVSQAAVAGDTAKDAKKLEARFAGEALEQRSANYKIRAAVSDYKSVPPFVLNERLGYELVQSTDEWPRTMLVAVASSAEAPKADGTAAAEGDSPSLLLRLVQADAHSDYKVTEIFALRGSIQMPEAAPANEGTAVLQNDIQTLQIAPQSVAATYAKALIEGGNSEAAQAFNLENDQLFTQSGAGWVAAEKERLADQEGKADYKASASQVDDSVTAISTGAGGALVMGTINEVRITTAEEDSELPVSDALKAVSSMDGNQKEIRQTVQHQVIFFVPNVDSEDKIQLLGATSELIKADGDPV